MTRDYTHLVWPLDQCDRCHAADVETFPDLDENGEETRALCANCCDDLGKGDQAW